MPTLLADFIDLLPEESIDHPMSWIEPSATMRTLSRLILDRRGTALSTTALSTTALSTTALSTTALPTTALSTTALPTSNDTHESD